MKTPATTTKVRVWDLPTRLFHWALAACVAGLFATAYVPGASIDVHARFGYAVLALLLFRLVWGFSGGLWSRFATFLPRPSALRAAWRGEPAPTGRAGHGVLGGLSVFAMLLALAAQVATGLVSDDEIAFTGPLNRFVSAASGLAATAWHAKVGPWLVGGLVVLHLLAVVFYLAVRRENLVGPMLHGDKSLPPGVPASADNAGRRMLGTIVLAACVLATYVLVVRVGAPPA